MKKYTIIYIIALLLCFSYTACKNPPIFAAIEQEVKLKKASVVGFVRGITQINNDLYVSNGKLFTKKVGDTGKWSSVSAPGNAGSLATDGTKLYGVFDGNAYVLDGSWKKVNPSIGIVGGTTTVFGQDSSKKIYTISGQTATFVANSNGIFKGAAGNFCITENGVYNTSGLVSGSGVPTLGLKAICEGDTASPDNVFVLTSETLYAYNGSTWTSIAHNQSVPQSVTYVKNRKLVLISGAGGFSEIKLDDSDPMNLEKAKLISVDRDALSSVPEAYYHQYLNSIGKWNINPIYSVTMDNDYIIYAGVLDSNTKYTGLWGFYNPGQLEWNRE